MGLWSFWRVHRGLPLSTGGAHGGDGGAAECQEVRTGQERVIFPDFSGKVVSKLKSGFLFAGWQKTWGVSVSTHIHHQLSLYFRQRVLEWSTVHFIGMLYLFLACFAERGFRPVTNFTRNLSALSSWYSVYTSAIAFIVRQRSPGYISDSSSWQIRPLAVSWSVVSACPPQVYMYAAWNGWTIPMFLFLALLRLSLNYLIARSLASPCLSSATQRSDLFPSFFTWQPLTVWIGVLIPCVVSLHWYLPVSSHDALLSGVGEFSGALCLRSQSPWWGIQSLRLRCSGWPELDSDWHLGLWCFQEPPKEDLTVSEKFQLVLDVAQRAQVRRDGHAEVLLTICPRCWTDLADALNFPFTESVWEVVKHLGENTEVSSSTRKHILNCWLWGLSKCAWFLCSLFMWVQPELTQKLYVGLLVAFVSSCLLPYKLLGFIIGWSDALKEG